MTVTDQFSSWTDAEMTESNLGWRNLSPGLPVADLKSPGFIHTQKRHSQFVWVQDRVDYHEPLPNFDRHWAQIQFALALLLWVIAVEIVASMVS